MATCKVKDCDKPATKAVDITPGPDYPVMQAAMCEAHALDHAMGGKLSDDGSELLMGDALPLEIIDARVSDDAHGVTVTLDLGRPPAVLQSVTFRAGRDFVIGDATNPWVQAVVRSKRR